MGSCVVMGAMASSAMVLAQEGPDAPAESPPLPAPEPTPTEPEAATEDVEAPAEPTAEPELTKEELKLLQESLAADQAEVASPNSGAAMTPSPAAAAASFLDVAVITDVAAAYFTGEPLQAGGHDPAENGFNLQQVEMALGGNVDPFFHFDANIVFSQFGVEVEEAYATTLELPANLQLRVGQFLTRFGRSNPTHPHTWKFVDQGLVNGRFFGSEGNRGLGTELSWLSPLPWFLELVGSVNNADGGSLIVGTQIVEELQDIQTLLFGTAVAVLPEDFHLVLGVAVVVTVIHLWWGSGFSAVALDAEGSRVRGMPTRVLEIGLLLTVALTISVTTRVLGALPVFGFSVLPAMAAIRLMPNVPRAMVVAAVIGAICGFGGYVLAFLYSLPVGAMQAMLGVAFVIVASALGAIGSRLAGSRAGKGVDEGASVAKTARP